jgi:predicted small secreted protein
MIRNMLLILTLGLALAACNTIEGAGQDISSGARTVGDSL